jgi:hypothetical protein
MSPKEELELKGQRLARWMDRNGFNEEVGQARRLAARQNATKTPQQHVSVGGVLIMAMLDGLSDRWNWINLENKVTSTLDRLQRNDHTKPVPAVPMSDDDQPFDL